jgi:hypothetical protein
MFSVNSCANLNKPIGWQQSAFSDIFMVLLDMVSNTLKLKGYTDSDWAGNSEDHKSTSGCCFTLGSAMISWFSRKQSSVAQSSTEAEYIAASMGAREAVWLRKLLFGLFGKPLPPTTIYCDNQSCIKLSLNPVFHNRSKHIETPYHYVRNMVERDVIKLEYISTEDQIADILTKPLAKTKVEFFRKELGMIVKSEDMSQRN